MRRSIKAALIILASLFISLIPAHKASAEVKTYAGGILFDPQYYAATYDDVFRSFGNNETALLNHYLLYGINEHRIPYAGYVPVTAAEAGPNVITMPDGELFDPIFYAQKYPDVANVFGADPLALYTHYITCGAKEGRLPYEGATESKIKLTFTNNFAMAIVSNPEDVLSAIRQAGKYKVHNLKILSYFKGNLTSEAMTQILMGQAVYMKTIYGASYTISPAKAYGDTRNLTIEINVTLKY